MDEEENGFFFSDTNRDNDKDKDKDEVECEVNNRDIIEDLDRYELHLYMNNLMLIPLCHVSRVMHLFAYVSESFVRFILSLIKFYSMKESYF